MYMFGSGSGTNFVINLGVTPAHHCKPPTPNYKGVAPTHHYHYFSCNNLKHPYISCIMHCTETSNFCNLCRDVLDYCMKSSDSGVLVPHPYN